MSETLHWVIIVGIIVIIILLFWIMASANKVANQVSKTQAIVLATASNLNSTATTVSNTANNINEDLQKDQPMFDYVRNFLCTNQYAQGFFGPTPKGLCPVAPSPAPV